MLDPRVTVNYERRRNDYDVAISAYDGGASSSSWVALYVISIRTPHDLEGSGTMLLSKGCHCSCF